MFVYFLNVMAPNGKRVCFRKNEEMENFTSLEDAEEYYRLQIKPWGFKLVDITQQKTRE